MDGDEAKILQLFRAVYPYSVNVITDELWLERWHWKFRKNPAGEGMIWMAEDRNRLAGHYALIPYNSKANNQEIKVCLSVDTMVHPDNRNQGLFTALVQAAHAQAKDSGVEFIIGFPNANSYPGAIKRLSFVELAETQTFIRPANLYAWLYKRLRIPVIADIGATLLRMWFWRPENFSYEGGELSEDDSFDVSYNEFWHKVSSHYEFAVDKSADFLRWRFAQVPQLTYQVLTLRRANQIRAFVVYRQPEETAHSNAVIYCLLAEDALSLRFLISQLLQRLEQQAVNALCWTGLADQWHYQTLRRQNFIKVKPKMRAPVCVAPIQKSSLPAEIAHGQWMVHYGDSDVL